MSLILKAKCYNRDMRPLKDEKWRKQKGRAKKRKVAPSFHKSRNEKRIKGKLNKELTKYY